MVNRPGTRLVSCTENLQTKGNLAKQDSANLLLKDIGSDLETFEICCSLVEPNGITHRFIPHESLCIQRVKIEKGRKLSIHLFGLIAQPSAKLADTSELCRHIPQFVFTSESRKSAAALLSTLLNLLFYNKFGFLVYNKVRIPPIRRLGPTPAGSVVAILSAALDCQKFPDRASPEPRRSDKMEFYRTKVVLDLRNLLLCRQESPRPQFDLAAS